MDYLFKTFGSLLSDQIRNYLHYPKYNFCFPNYPSCPIISIATKNHQTNCIKNA